MVAVIDHEHFRMKLMYKQKKQVSADLKTAKSNFKDLQVTVLRLYELIIIISLLLFEFLIMIILYLEMYLINNIIIMNIW